MSGHSKWSTIKRKKEKTDGQKAKLFTRLGREIAVAVKAGGAVVDNNPRLKYAIDRARSFNMPSENITRCIKKADSTDSNDNVEELVYEGYGPAGTAFIVETMTDNKKRTVSDLRHYFDKFGGKLANSGCVSYMFERKGILVINSPYSEDKIIDDALAADAEDVSFEDGVCAVITSAENFENVRRILADCGYEFETAQLFYQPLTFSVIESDSDMLMFEKLMDKLSSHDDVQDVWHNLKEK